MNLNGSFTCDCTEGWTGQYCEIGTLNISNSNREYTFPLHFLEFLKSCRSFTDIDECLTLQCGYGGTCNNLNGSFVCECPSGYFGSPCEGTITRN